MAHSFLLLMEQLKKLVFFFFLLSESNQGTRSSVCLGNWLGSVRTILRSPRDTQQQQQESVTQSMERLDGASLPPMSRRVWLWVVVLPLFFSFLVDRDWFLYRNYTHHQHQQQPNCHSISFDCHIIETTGTHAPIRSVTKCSRDSCHPTVAARSFFCCYFRLFK